MESPRARPNQHRDPPPALFLGPPSQNASRTSLPGIAPSSGSAPVGNAPTSTVDRPSTSTTTTSRRPASRHVVSHMRLPASLDIPRGGMSTAAGVGDPLPGWPHTSSQQQQQQQQSQHSQPQSKRPAPRVAEAQSQTDRTDALWAEMQNTLEEVELSAVNGLRVFGPEHSRALEALRKAQIGLAEAWARGEVGQGDQGGSSTGGAEDGEAGHGERDAQHGGDTSNIFDGPGAGNSKPRQAGEGQGRPDTAAGGGAGRDTAESMGSRMEEETAADIASARRRREENDQYFQRVNDSVLDVVARLEDVATAMRSVELETRDIWGDNESTATSVKD